MPDKKPGHWRSLLKSFDSKFYIDIVNQSFGRSFVYILLLSFIVSFLISLRVKIDYNKFAFISRLWIEKHVDDIWPKGLTEVRINNGEVSSDVKQPYIHQWNDFALILDTTGEIRSLTDYKNGILILKDKILVKVKKRNESRVNEYDLSGIDNFVIRPGDSSKGIIAEISMKDKSFNINLNRIKFWADVLGHTIFFAMLLLLFSLYSSTKLIQGAFFALLSMMPNKMLGANLGYSKLLNISLYALTPSTILAVIGIMAKIKFLMFWPLYTLIYLTYIYLAIKNINESGARQDKTPFITGGTHA